MIRRRCRFFVAGLLAVSHSLAIALSACDTSYLLHESRPVVVQIDSTQPRAFQLGLNVEAVPFEKSLWRLGGPRARAETWLAAMPGVLLRYPGGSVSNVVDLRAAVGAERRAQRLTDWSGPGPLRFGPAEYNALSDQVGATPWLVANLWGDDSGLLPGSVVLDRFRTVLDQWPAAGLPQRIELGNEIYFARWKMGAAEYATRVLAFADLLTTKAPSVRPVVGLAGMELGGQGRRFNREVLDIIGDRAMDVALHYYYDGPPGGPPIAAAIANLCERVADVRASPLGAARVWITEHGRWPGGRVADPDWQKRWPRSFDLGAAISSAEFTLAAARIPEVRGLFLHALAGVKGPWRSFVERGDGSVEPTAPAVALQLLYPLAEGGVLPTRVETPALGRNALVGAVGFQAADGRLGVVMTNRADALVEVKVVLKHFASSTRNYEMVTLSGDTMEHTHARRPGVAGFVVDKTSGTATFDADGASTLTIPPRAVMQVRFTS